LPHDGRNNARSRTSTRRTDHPCRVAGRRHKSLCLGPASYEFSTARALDQRLVLRPQDIDLGLDFGALGTGWVDVRETTLDGSPLGEHVADTVHLGRELRGRPLDRIEERPEPAVGLFEDRGTDPHELSVESPECPLGKDPLRPRREVRGAPRFLFRRVGWDATTYQAWSDEQLATQQSFVTPTAWNGETVLRLCFVNPLTTLTHVAEILDSLR